MKKLIRNFTLTPRDALVYAAIATLYVFLNFAMPNNEPLSFALFFAALSIGLSPFVVGIFYIISSVALLNRAVTLVFAIQGAFCMLVFTVYSFCKKRVRLERYLYALLAQLPFLFLYPYTGYALFGMSLFFQKILLSVFFTLACMLFEGALSAISNRLFRCRLSAPQLAEISLLAVTAGIGLLNVFPRPLPVAIAVFALLFSVALIKNASALPLAIVLSLPFCIKDASLVPLAVFAIYACAALVFIPYGKMASALSFFLVFAGWNALNGIFYRPPAEIAFTLMSGAIPVLLIILIPDKLLSKLSKTLLLYRERSLPRIAVNRNRRAVGQQLYEVSSLFREIETAFTDNSPADDGGDKLKEKLMQTLCASCQNRKKCERGGVFESVDKLIAVGKAKGRVNLIDLPEVISSACPNSAGMLFSLNKLLAGYHKYVADMRSAREGRKLLAEQAHGVSEILKDIALEQSEEFSFSGNERTLVRAFQSAGFVVTEAFLYGDRENLTVNITLPADMDGKLLCKIAGNALNIPLTLAEKIPLNAVSACYILRRKAAFDAAFGIAARVKDGERVSGDTHSVLKIDERRFLVALSDGMGSGDDARSVSDRALTLLECFYKAKMPSDTVLNTVNRLIAFSSDEQFSCLDLAAVNLDTGSADIVKIGSPAGFLLSGDELRVLEGDSLPIGMLEAVHPATLRVTMKADDFLLFMSDGVSQAFGSSAELCSYMSALRPLNPQSLAEELLSNAVSRYRGKAEDDMTVIAVKLMQTG